MAAATEDWVKQHVIEELRQMKEIGGQAAMTLMEARTRQQEIIDTINGEIARADDIVTKANTLQNGLNQTYDELKAQGLSVASEMTNVNAKMDFLNGRGIEMDTKLATMQEQFDLMVGHSNTFAVQVKEAREKQESDLEDAKTQIRNRAKKIQEDIASGAELSPFGKGEGKSGGQKLNAKDLAVWKLPTGVSKPDFRHWADTIDVNLEEIHKWDRPDQVLDKVRRMKTEVTEDMLKQAIKEIDDVRGDGLMIDSSKWYFEEKTRFLFNFLVNKLNTELHEKTIGIEKKNGFELYRLVYNSVDALPENAAWHLDAQIMALPQHCKAMIKGIKELYGFRLHLKTKIAAYKKIVGEEPNHNILGQIIWQCMDDNSRQLASQSGLDKQMLMNDGKTPVDRYVLFTEDIDRRYRVQFGTLEFKAATNHAKDDPMGLSAMFEPTDGGATPGDAGGAPSSGDGGGSDHGGQAGGDLDAFAKGKGKGKGTWVNDGKCNKCRGTAHYGRDCPTILDAEGKIVNAHVECHGCGGKGHYKDKCPTVHPHLKGKGKGDKGKGKGGSWNGKGKGGEKGKVAEKVCTMSMS